MPPYKFDYHRKSPFVQFFELALRIEKTKIALKTEKITELITELNFCPHFFSSSEVNLITSNIEHLGSLVSKSFAHLYNTPVLLVFLFVGM